MRYSVVRVIGAPAPLGSNAFLSAAAARLCSDSRCLSSPLQVLARFHYGRAAVRSSPRDTGNLSGDRCCASGTPFAESHRLAPAANRRRIKWTLHVFFSKDSLSAFLIQSVFNEAHDHDWRSGSLKAMT